jgi:hypothetical protein
VVARGGRDVCNRSTQSVGCADDRLGALVRSTRTVWSLARCRIVSREHERIYAVESDKPMRGKISRLAGGASGC